MKEIHFLHYLSIFEQCDEFTEKLLMPLAEY